ncbi:MAG: hypothetical protein QG617_210 [Campylobacterota bacterium]|nr:hypothetical protein [Campylobacterota bacterium]
MSIFDNYALNSSCDEMFDREGNIREAWVGIFNKLQSTEPEILEGQQAQIDWIMEDNGVTYNIYDKMDGNANRSWSLDPIPFVIAQSEWDELKKGLKQRAKLLNLILRDLYSEQRLLKDNIIPAEVIFSHKGFLPQLRDFGTKENFNLYFYAADLARGPDRRIWVINDRAHAPSGLGYAIENRLTMNVVAKNLHQDISTKKLFNFLEEFKNLFKKFKYDENSTAVLLTPGPYNETYFEHSYLSSFFDIKLAQGGDLLCKNGSVWLKNLGGLKNVDTILRRVDDKYCDPLELKHDSRLGVSGLVDAIRQSGINMINPIGSGILENLGINPFMEKISQYFLGESLILPQIATWWCGQKNELAYVLENIETLIVKNIDKTDDLQVFFCSKMSKEEIKNLKELLLQTPDKYVAQEEISFSTVPFYHNKTVEPRSASIRAFCLKTDDDYSVMNGGLVRVSTEKNVLLISSQKGGTSKDLWVLGDDDFNALVLSNSFENSRSTETFLVDLLTQKAENLFWLGRYLARIITSTRFVLHVLKKSANFSKIEDDKHNVSQDILQKALTHLTMTYPGFFDEKNRKNINKNHLIEISSIIKDVSRQGSLSFTFSMLSNTNMNLKDILTIESSKLFKKLQREWSIFTSKSIDSSFVLAGELDKMLIVMIAYKELVKESIYKEQGLVLFDIGYRIENALLLISKARSIMCQKVEKSVEYDILEGLLNSIESFNAYRVKYKSSLLLKNVIEFLIFNNQFPKSLFYITQELLNELKLLPKSKNELSAYEKPIVEASALLNSLDIGRVMQIKDDEVIYFEFDKILSQLSEFYIECSNEFSKTYFSHYGE